jgi:hypothetical protein
VQRSRKNGSIHPLPYTPSWRIAYLVKYRDNFTFLWFSEQLVANPERAAGFQIERSVDRNINNWVGGSSMRAVAMIPVRLY